MARVQVIRISDPRTSGGTYHSFSSKSPLALCVPDFIFL